MTSQIVLTRREFLKMASVLGVSATFQLYRQEIVEALVVRRAHVFWLHTSNCTGCTYGFLSAIPELEIVLTQALGNETSEGPVYLPYWLPTVNPLWSQYGLEKGIEAWKAAPSPRLLIVEGAIPMAYGGKACTVGPYISTDLVADLAEHADAVVAAGACASFGGIPAASPNPTSCIDVKTFLRGKGIDKLVIRESRCPAHPEALALTVVSVITGVIPERDEYDRPLAFFEAYDGYRPRTVHDHCPRVHYYHAGIFAEKPGDPGCMFKLGCRGPYTSADCTLRKWNRGTSSCTEVGSPCLGCAQPGWPDEFSPFWVQTEAVPVYFGLTPVQWTQLVAAASIIGVGIHLARKVVRGVRA